jgi:PhnB protein
MTTSHKPEGYSTVSPYLVVGGAENTIAFLTSVFGAAELRRFPAKDGKVLHAEVRLDDSIIMLGDAGDNWPATGAHVHVYVPDVDAAYQRALDAGASSVQPPTRQEGDDDKRGGVKDAGGTTWWIGTKVA